MTIQYDPQKVTDWLTPLEKVYARQSQQLDTYHQQLRERDRQEEEATLNVPEMFSKLASFSQTISQVVEARKTGQKRKVGNKIANLMPTGEDNDAAIEYYKERYKLGKDDLLKDNPDLEKLLKNIKDDDFREYIRNSSKKQHILNKEILALEYTKGLQGKYKAHVNNLNDLKAQQEYDGLQGDQARKDHFTKFARNELELLGLSEEIIANNIFPEVKKIRDTEVITKRNKIKNRVYAVKTINLENSIDVNRNLSGDEAAKNLQLQLNTLATEFGGDMEPAKEETTTMLERLGLGQKLQMHEWKAILDGKIKHPSGTTGAILLSDEQKLRVHNAILAGQNRYLAEHKAKVGTQIESDTAQAISGQISQDQLDGQIRYYESIGETERIKQLKNISVANQTKAVYNDTIKRYSEIVNGNDPAAALQLKPNIELEGNVTARDELLAVSTEASQALTAANLPNTWDGFFNKSVKGDMIAGSGIDKTLDPDATFTENQERVQLFVAKHRLNKLIKARRIGESVESAEAMHQAWLKGHGWGQVNGGGLLSPNSEGVFERFEFVQDAKIQNNTKPSKFQQETWTGRIHNTTKDFKGDIEAALNKAESYIDKEDTLGVFIEKVNEKGEIELFYSPELITKSLALGRQPSYVLKKSIEALIADKEKYGDFVKMFDLKGKLELLNDAPDLKFKEMLEELGNKDLIYSYNYLGGFTPKQKLRILNSRISEKTRELETEKRRKDLIEKAKKKNILDKRIEQNTQARNAANQIGQGIQEYFEGTDERSEEEINDQFNSQPGIF